MIFHRPDEVQLIAANGTKIRNYGEREIQLRLEGRLYTWNFIPADVQRPLLGADILAHHNLIVDVAGQRLLNKNSIYHLPLQACLPADIIDVAAFTPSPGQYNKIIEQYREVFKPELNFTPGTAAKHGVYHHIKTTGPPVHSRFRRLRSDKLHQAKKAFAERMGVCIKAFSP